MKNHRHPAKFAALVLLVVCCLIACGGNDDGNEVKADGPPVTLATVTSALSPQSISQFRLEARFRNSVGSPIDPMPLKETHGAATEWFERSAPGSEGPAIVADPYENSSPAVVSWDHSLRADVFFVGPDHALRHTASGDGGATWASDSLGAPSGYELYGTPAATSGALNSIDVLALGRSSTGQASVFRRKWNGLIWSGWSPVASVPTLTSGPFGIAAAAWSATRIDFWVRTGASQFTHYASNDSGTSWSYDYASPGGGVRGLPVAVSWGPGRVDLFYVRNDNGALGQRAWNGSTWVEATAVALGMPSECAGRSTQQLRGADTTRAAAGPVTLTVAMSCPNTSSSGDTTVYLKQYRTSWANWVDATTQAAGARETATYSRQDSGALITWNRSVTSRSPNWGYEVADNGQRTPIRGTYFFPGDQAANMDVYTFYPSAPYNFSWSTSACNRAHVLREMGDIGVNTVVMSYWGGEQYPPMATTPAANDLVFDSALGIGADPYCDVTAPALRILPAVEISAFPGVSVAGLAADIRPSNVSGSRVASRVAEVVYRYWVAPQDPQWRKRWARVYDKTGNPRLAIQLIGVASNHFHMDNHSGFISALESISQSIFDTYGVRVGLMIDPGTSHRPPLADQVNGYSPRPNVTPFQDAPSFLAIQGFWNEIYWPAQVYSAAPADADGRCRDIAANDGFHCSDNAGENLSALGRNKLARLKGWLAQGLPVVVDVSTGYDGSYVFGNEFGAYWGDSHLGYDGRWRNHVASLKGLRQVDANGFQNVSVGITFNAWNAYTEGNVGVKSRRVIARGSAGQPGQLADPTAFDDVQFRWLKDVYAGDPQACSYRDYLPLGATTTPYAVFGLICSRWQEDGGYLGYGAPISNETAMAYPGLGTGVGQHFSQSIDGVSYSERGLYFRQGAVMAYPVWGKIYEKYKNMNEANSYLGFPTASEQTSVGTCPGGANGQFSSFEGGVINFCPAVGGYSEGVWAVPPPP